MFPGRKLVLSIDVLHLVDAALVLSGYWLASLARDPVRELAGMMPMGGRSLFADMSWVLYVAVPFTPLVLGHFKFYENIRQKPLSRALSQILKTLAVVGLVLGLIVVFSRLPGTSRIVLVLAAPISGFLLLLRDRITHRWSSEPIQG